MTLGQYLAALLAAIIISIPCLHVLGWAMRSDRPIFYARVIASFTAMCACGLYGVVASAFLRIVGHGGLGQWTTARAFKWTMWYMTGVTFEVEDREGGWAVRPAVFVSNHQTELDVLMLGCMFPKYCSITAKSSLRWWPFVGWFMVMAKAIFINRTSSKDARAALAGAVQRMHSEKISVLMFPEGTRSYYDKPDMLPFRKGAFHLAIQAQVPVVPVVVANYSNVLNLKRKSFKSGTVPVSILKPIETKGMTKDDVENLMGEVRSVMEKELVRITCKAAGVGVARPGESANGLMNGAQAVLANGTLT